MLDQVNGYTAVALSTFLAGASPSADPSYIKISSPNGKMIPVASETIEEPICRARGQVADVLEEAQSPGWDGYGASPVPESAEFHANMLLNQLVPFCHIAPDVAPEADGNIELEWFRDKEWRLVASVDGRGIVCYAAKCGDASQTGRLSRIDENTTEGLRQVLSRIYE